MNRSDVELQQWAHEHLTYEAGMLLHTAAKASLRVISDTDRNAFIEAFAVHVRCLRDFLWRDRRPMPEDALAIDFCLEGRWQSARGSLPESLAAIEGSRNRIGREIVHLSYHRLDISTEAKAWDMGDLLRDIADELARFSAVADPKRLAEPTREALALLPGLVPGSRVMEPLRSSPYLPGMSQATGGLHKRLLRGGTLPFPGFETKDLPGSYSSGSAEEDPSSP